ncbi:MAG: alpha-L-fucosidase [Promethearchaeia archaeon]
MLSTDTDSSKNKEWWKGPGLGIQFQIEIRPGWLWNRNYDKYNELMKDVKGNLNFNGPFCKIKDWVRLSKELGADYHSFESKWHDGICFFNTKYIDWKTPTDYCKIFADESRKAEIPFLFYYSNIFDHNPLFDDIQPFKNGTSSFIAMHSKLKK